MNDPLPVLHDVSLRAFNSFGLDAKASVYLRVTSAEQLVALKRESALMALPRLVLGGGSNIVLTHDFPGLVLHMATQGITLTGEDADASYICAAAGETWHNLVLWTLEQGLGGLENMSLIPGSVGASPVQNIGAYGAELADFLHELTIFDFETGNTRTLSKADCAFGYRDSIFKHALKDKATILDITLALPKRWQPNIAYADVTQELAARGITAPTARQISDVVIAIRTHKLPDPAVTGNAGSFFKNPVVSAAEKAALVSRYPQLVSYAQPDGSFKLAAGWLIDQCGWKGKTSGAAGVCDTQALVLVNRGGASGQDVVQLAQAIQADVAEKFGVKLEPEPVFV